MKKKKWYSVMRSTHGNREFADLTLLLCSNRSRRFDSLGRLRETAVSKDTIFISELAYAGERHAHSFQTRQRQSREVKCGRGGKWAWEEREHVLGSESAIGLGRGLPIGVIRERPMLALLETCMMMNERRGLWLLIGSCRVPEKRALLGGKCDDDDDDEGGICFLRRRGVDCRWWGGGENDDLGRDGRCVRKGGFEWWMPCLFYMQGGTAAVHVRACSGSRYEMR